MFSIVNINISNMQEPKRIVLKETSTQRLSGRRRKVVVTKEEIIYIPLLKTLETIFEEVMH